MDHIARYAEWLAAAELTADERARLTAMTDEEKKESFWAPLEFGTAGMRGVIDLGVNRMNRFTVGRATKGLADYVCSLGEDAKIAILATGLDSESDDFAQPGRDDRGNDTEHYRALIKKLYSPGNGRSDTTPQAPDKVPFTVNGGDNTEPGSETSETDTQKPQEGTAESGGTQTEDTPDSNDEDINNGTGEETTDNGNNSTNTNGTDIDPQPKQPTQGGNRLVDRLKKIWNDMLKEP